MPKLFSSINPSDCSAPNLRTALRPFFIAARLFVLIALLSRAKESFAAEKTPDPERPSEAIMKKVSAAIVRVNSRNEHASTGVIVSSDGYVVHMGASESPPDFSVTLANGEIVPATNLGWSQEWQVGLLKLKGDRKWPHVERGTTAQSHAGDRIFEIGYRAKKDKKGEFDSVTRFGKLKLVSRSHWFATDLAPTSFEYGAGTFDKDGKLLGISVPGHNIVHHLSTAIDIVASNWKDLANGKNLDWVRFPPSEKSLYRQIAAPEDLERTGFVPRKDVPVWKDAKGNAKIDAPNDFEVDEKEFEKARKIAIETTVRIRRRSPLGPERKADNQGSIWSGVLISKDGYISTCAHSAQIAGDELTVVMRDNRQFRAVALGTNWISDTGLIKITESGEWPFAELGDSSVIGPRDAVLHSGFAGPDSDPLRPVGIDLHTMQITPYIGWSTFLMFKYRLTPQFAGGSSGGGVFDKHGKLVGITVVPGIRIEMLRAQLEYLKNETALAGPAETK